MSTAASGLRIAEQAYTRAAAATLRATLPQPAASSSTPIAIPPSDPTDGVVAQMQARAAFRANLAVYRTANDLYRALLKATAP